ncbi:MAG TPA: transglycosylase SLT domain-containing protein [Salinarimonas sp.]|nr:transglycosylase SLT domain-containing protein [Salinarimonas sp.]
MIPTRRAARLAACAALMGLLHMPVARAEAPPAVLLADDAESLSTRAIEARVHGPGPRADRRPGFDEARSVAEVDVDRLREAIEHYRRGRVGEGDRLRDGLADPTARALAEWVAIRSGAALGHGRITAFLQEHPGWPTGAMVRRRAEESLLSDRKSPAAIRAFFAEAPPMSPPGRLALALAHKALGDADRAAELIRDTWRNDSAGQDFETRVLEAFPGVLTRDDHRIRMERHAFRGSWETARRAALRAGEGYADLLKARQAVAGKSKKAEALLAAVPAALRSEPGFLFARAQHLRRAGKYLEAAKAMAPAPRDPDSLVDGDAWWVERRALARELLDLGENRAAYEVARAHGARSDQNRIDAEFHAGWIALRFLNEPETAASHFTLASTVAETPISIARAAYWQGRAAEAAGRPGEARWHYERAALRSITYYGQLARRALGRESLPLRSVAADTAARAEVDRLAVVRALDLLYRANLTDLTIPLYADIGARLNDPRHLDAVAGIAVARGDARGLLALGKAAVQRGFPLDLHAYPTLGIPSFQPVGGRVESAMVYAIARQESAFHPTAVSHAGARGLMQLMPATAKRTAQRFKVGFAADRLTTDAAYNAKLGAAHLSELMEDWKGSLILTFASYNAGGGNVARWIRAYGDPRRPDVDPVDWVERIPFYETRNYVQRVSENFLVYRQRLGERVAGADPGVQAADAEAPK